MKYNRARKPNWTAPDRTGHAYLLVRGDAREGEDGAALGVHGEGHHGRGRVARQRRALLRVGAWWVV